MQLMRHYKACKIGRFPLAVASDPVEKIETGWGLTEDPNRIEFFGKVMSSLPRALYRGWWGESSFGGGGRKFGIYEVGQLGNY